jgi:hypothetical protein
MANVTVAAFEEMEPIYDGLAQQREGASPPGGSYPARLIPRVSLGIRPRWPRTSLQTRYVSR